MCSITIITDMKTKTSKSPKKSGQVRVPDKNSRPKSPLFSSTAKAEQEIAGLRRGRERIESELTPDDTGARDTLI